MADTVTAPRHRSTASATLDLPPRTPNDRPKPPDPIPDAASLRYAARAYGFETHSERDAESWERIFAAEGADVRAAAIICARLRSSPGAQSLAWLFDFVEQKLDSIQVPAELGALLGVARAFGAAPTRRERERLGVAATSLIEQLDVREAPHVAGIVYDLTMCVWGFAHALRSIGADHPVTESELRGVVRVLAELRAHRTGRAVAEHAATLADELVKAHRGAS